MNKEDIEKVIGSLSVQVGKVRNEIFVSLTATYRDLIGREWHTVRFIPFVGRRTKKGMKYETTARGHEIQ